MEAIDELLVEAEAYRQQFKPSQKETVQHLIELGYLLPELLSPYSFDRQLEKAMALFQKELWESPLLPAKELERLKQLHDEDFEPQLLHMLTDLDEGLPLPALPKSGEISLLSRLVHYRLDVMGLFEYKIKHPYGPYSVLQLARLQQYTSAISRLDAINQLADLEGFTEKLVRIIGQEACILVFKLPEGSFDEDQYEVRPAFRKRLKDDFERSSQFYQLMRKEVLRQNDRKVNYDFLEERSKNELNQFIIRLIQVHQWTDGFYDGLLDHDLGPVSFEAIVAAIRLFNDDENEEDIKVKEILAHVGNGYFVFNALYFLKKYMVEEEKTDYEQSTIHNLGEQLRTAEPAEREAFHQKTAQLIDGANQTFDSEEQQIKQGLFKRIYYGIKGFFRKLFRLGKKLFKWVINRFDQLKELLTGFFKKALAHARQALRALIKGIKYLIGRHPFVTVTPNRNLLVSHIPLDGDGFSIMNPAAGSHYIAQHLNQIKDTVHALDFSLALLTTLLQSIKYFFSVIGWPLLLLHLVRAFKVLSAKYELVKQNA